MKATGERVPQNPTRTKSKPAPSTLRNPPKPISFASSARRPSFDLVAELFHSATALKEDTNGEGSPVNLGGLPDSTRQLLRRAVNQAEANAIEAGDDRAVFTPSMAIVACVKYAGPILVYIAKDFQKAKKDIDNMVGDNDIGDDPIAKDLLAIITAKAEINFRCGGPATKGMQLTLSKNMSKCVGKYAADAGLEKTTFVDLAVNFTIATQHHTVSAGIREDCSNLVRRYELTAMAITRSMDSDLELLKAHRDDRKKASGK